MQYTKEEIYSTVGQFDKVVGVFLKYNSAISMKYEKYDNFITGKFIYTLEERQALESALSQDIPSLSDEYINFKLDLEDGNSINEKIKASDIVEMVVYNKPAENQFTKKEIRHLPNPIKIKIESHNSESNSKEIFIGLNRSMISEGYELIYSEIAQYNSMVRSLYEHLLKPKDIQRYLIENNVQSVIELTNFYYLKEVFYKSKLSFEQNLDFLTFLNNRIESRTKMIDKELKKAGTTFEKFLKSDSIAKGMLSNMAIFFEDERLTCNKLPVWWDFERFIHIFFRHVREMKNGKILGGDNFQYAIEDVKGLIKLVLASISDEIQNHFENSPQKLFNRNGSMSIYYQGDFYNLRIEANTRRLMTFYKRGEIIRTHES